MTALRRRETAGPTSLSIDLTGRPGRVTFRLEIMFRESRVRVVRPVLLSLPSLGGPLPPRRFVTPPRSMRGTPFSPHETPAGSRFPQRGPCPPITGRGRRDENTTSVKSLILEIEALICADVSGAAG